MDSDGVSWLRGPILGKGAFGSVFLATLRRSNARTPTHFPPKMAVKSADFSSSASLQKEKEVLNNLYGSPYLLTCFGDETTFGNNGQMIYNVLLEYASGGTLADAIKKSDGLGLPESDVRHYTKCLLEGLSHVHDCGYVHCDLKPDNVLLVPGKSGEFVAKIGDFGLAKKGRQIKRKKKLMCSYLRGTAMYLAPETVVDHLQEVPSDVWSLGCVVFEMLTGKKPWNLMEKNNNRQVVNLIADENALPEIPLGVSREGRDFLMGCLVREPGMRLTTEMLLNHPFVQGLSLDDEQLEDGSHGLSEEEEILGSDSEFSSDCSSFTSSSEEEDFGCVADREKGDSLSQAQTQASSNPTMLQRPSLLPMPHRIHII